MTALHLDNPLEFGLSIKPIKGVSMKNITETISKKAAYIEAASCFDSDTLAFYFCDKDGAYITVSDDDIRVCGNLSVKDSEPGEHEHAIYYAMYALSLLGEVEDIAIIDTIHIFGYGLVTVWISSCISESDVTG